VVHPGQLRVAKYETFPSISQPHAALVVKYISQTVAVTIIVGIETRAIKSITNKNQHNSVIKKKLHGNDKIY